MTSCLECGRKTLRSSYTYCSNKCQWRYQYKKYLEDWKSGVVNGSRGVNAKNISRYVKHFLLEKYKEKCCLCGWNIKHPTTNNVPLEVDHIDGNAENNSENNLRLLCPNCHSLTPSFRNLNKGKGRNWRKIKYLKSQ